MIKCLECHHKQTIKKIIDNRVGELSWNWKGGISDYKNQKLMQKNRTIIFNKYNNKCRNCGKKARHIHHLDNSKDNHSLENLIPLCLRCHYKVHSGRENKKSKFISLYGLTLKNISKKLNITISKTLVLHELNLLEKYFQ